MAWSQWNGGESNLSILDPVDVAIPMVERKDRWDFSGLVEMTSAEQTWINEVGDAEMARM